MSEIVESGGVNADQIAYWNSKHGEKWVTLQSGLDAIHVAALRHLMDRASPTTGARVLDVGCGAGSSTLAFASLRA